MIWSVRGGFKYLFEKALKVFLITLDDLVLVHLHREEPLVALNLLLSLGVLLVQIGDRLAVHPDLIAHHGAGLLEVILLVGFDLLHRALHVHTELGWRDEEVLG